MALPAYGDVNRVALFLGPPECGKSNLAMREFLAGGDAYRFAHESVAKLPARVEPEGTVPVYVRHETIAACRAAIARDARGVHAIGVRDGGDVLGLGMATGKASLAAHGGARGVPVRVLLDESGAASGSAAHRLGDLFEEYLARRRHYHTELYLGCQSPWRLHYAFIELSTDVYVFKLDKRQSIARLEDEGMPDELLARVPHLGAYEFVHWRRLRQKQGESQGEKRNEKPRIMPRNVPGRKGGA